MGVAIIVSTHGSSAEQLVNTVEMLIGKKENVSYINFNSNENLEVLTKKFELEIKNLDSSDGLLFLVDIWGGSPFNAANRIVKNHLRKEISVITGVNVPMIISVFLSLEERDVNFNKLVQDAFESGKDEIKLLSRKEGEIFQKIEEKVSNDRASRGSIEDDESEHMKIVLARIDDRLIHGQVATRWTKDTKVNRIIVINDEIYQDKVRSTLLKQVSPPGVSAHVVNVDRFVRVYFNPKYHQDRVMLLFTNPGDVLRIVESGVKIDSVNIGGMAYKEGKKQICDSVSIDEDDVRSFMELHKKGIELEIRKVTNDKRIEIVNLIRNRFK
ncbi:PTS mannose transporter subunit IIAB [Candidatus Riesia pediculischaeffi]|uniref:PTS system mannose-specific EIIAB component n=1 Tax=Candidatus Riesia pediculischaeffi TaxID=428411 RepID=A0A1V0HL33_9ENTR|nr:PTS mannose transporter subunit IIAB [Candidatus Riesia pediculischaeffi]ARC53540.1 PTS mannose transporter subunit IIAB [Candidatus Riesia pediculischaeffi]